MAGKSPKHGSTRLSKTARRRRLGFEPGDLVLSIDGTTIESFSDLQRIVASSADIPLKLWLIEDGERVDADGNARASGGGRPLWQRAAMGTAWHHPQHDRGKRYNRAVFLASGGNVLP